MNIPRIILFLCLALSCNNAIGQLAENKKKEITTLRKIISTNKHDTLVAKAYLDLSEILAEIDFDTVVVLCKKSAFIAQTNLKGRLTARERFSFQMTLAGAYNNIGYIYDDQGKVVEALEYYHKSLSIREKINDKIGIAVSLNNIGIIHLNQGENEQALDYYLRSLKIKEVLGDEKSIATSLNNIGAIYRKSGDLDKAINYYQRSLAIRDKLKDRRGVAISLNNLGTAYMKMDSLDKALDYYLRSLEIRKERGDDRGTTNTLCNIGNVIYLRGDYKLAESYALQSLKLSQDLGYSERIKDASKLLSDIYGKEKKWKQAYEMQSLYLKMKDSIRNIGTEVASVKLSAQYKIDAVEKEKKLLAKQNDLQAQLTDRNRIVASFFTAAFILALILVLVVYRGYRKKNLINELLEKQKKNEEKKNEEKSLMIKEIHHRVKNNLQVVISLLRLQASQISDEKVAAMFLESRNRILSMAKIHEQMYQSKDLKHINIEGHFTSLINDLLADYQIDSTVQLKISIVANEIGIRTLIPLGLIINEMISNSLKHGFKDRKEGTIRVTIKQLEGIHYEMMIGDDGVGMSENFNMSESKTFGTQLIQSFTEQLNGTIERIKQPGSLFRITFENIDVIQREQMQKLSNQSY